MGAGGELEQRLRDLGAFIREQRVRTELSLRKLAELAGVSNPYLSQIERGLRKPSAEILQALARALHISAETLYVQAGILDPGGPAADTEQAILADPGLGDRHKQALIEVYRSFRREHDGTGPPAAATGYRGTGEARGRGGEAHPG